jgi:hypothetical protein
MLIKNEAIEMMIPVKRRFGIEQIINNGVRNYSVEGRTKLKF